MGPLGRGLFVTGTDTDVGKTMVAAWIAGALAARGERVAVLKPAVTGLEDGGDTPPDHELLRSAARSPQAPGDVAPYRFAPALSPHLAARLAGEAIDPAVLKRSALRAAGSADVLVVEGVGGLLVPLVDAYLVRDFAADLGLPVVIAARPVLGTINHSLLTIEAARAAGLRVAGVVLTPWPAQPGKLELSNREAIEQLGGVEVSTLSQIDVASITRHHAPARERRPKDEWGAEPVETSAALPLERWLGDIGRERATGGGEHFRQGPRLRSAALTPRPEKSCVWHPFTQMRDWSGERAPVIEGAQGSWLIDVDGRRYIDGVSSLWCNVHGHRHPRLDAAVRAQLERVAHSTTLGLSHPGVEQLARRLVELAPRDSNAEGDGSARRRLSRVFFSDSGSSAVEVALKMAFQYWRQAGKGDRRTTFVSLEDAYHGDTLGAVSVGGIDLFHSLYQPLLFDSVRVPAGNPEALELALDERRSEIAAVVLEPLIQGAAGMKLHPPGYLRAARELCDRYDVLLICDEVATGFGRTGTMFACEQEDVVPDLLCLGKGLTGGYLPLAATLATDRLYEAFLGEYDEFKTFFHGHTYTGNPLACAAALATLDTFAEERTLERLAPKVDLLRQLLHDLVEPLPHVAEIRQIGLMCGVELASVPKRSEPYSPSLRMGHRVALEARRRGAILRPLGDVVVLMPPLAIAADELEELVEIAADSIAAATGMSLQLAA